jgi:hypothetical protein
LTSETLPDFRPASRRETREAFLTRLERLVRLRQELLEELNELGLALLDRAIYSTYRDCVDAGAGYDARRLTLAGRPWSSALRPY